MWAKLARHAPAEVEIQLSKAVQSPQEKPAVASSPLVWGEVKWTGPKDDPRLSGYILSQCGRFSINGRRVNRGYHYMAWFRKDPPHESVSLGIRTTRREAEHLCELEAVRDALERE